MAKTTAKSTPIMTSYEEKKLRNDLNKMSKDQLIELSVKLKKLWLTECRECQEYKDYYLEHVSLDELIKDYHD